MTFGRAAGPLRVADCEELRAGSAALTFSPGLDKVFGLDAERIRNPVDIVEVGNHLRGIMYGAVIKASRTQRIQVCRQHFGRGVREFGCKLAQRAVYG